MQLPSTLLLTTLLLPLSASAAPQISIHPSLSSLIPSFSIPTPTLPSINPSLIPSFPIPTPLPPSVSLPGIGLPLGIGLPKRGGMQHVERQLPSISIHPSLSSLIPSFSLPTVTAPPLPTATAPGTGVGTGGTVSATGISSYYANRLKQVKRKDLENDDQRGLFERMMD